MLPKTAGTVLVLFVLLQVFLLVNCYSGSSMLKPKRNGKSRQKRILSLITDPALNFYFEYNSCYALAVVLSLPLEQPASRSVFLSYNFETNYYYAYFDNAQGLTPVPFSTITQPGTNTGDPFIPVKHPNSYGQENSQRQLGDESQLNNDSTNKTEVGHDEKLPNKTSTNDIQTEKSASLKSKNSKTKHTKAKSDLVKTRKLRGLLDNYFMSRRRFFKMIESKMDSSALNGRDCLLKAICETAANSFGHHNGVLGSIVDILFLPSASKDEQLPKKYYKAEANGKSNNCRIYEKNCPRSIFDFISTIV